MGDITEAIFDGIAKNRQRKNIDRQRTLIERQQNLESNKRDFAKAISDADARTVLSGLTEEELEHRIKSHLDVSKVGDAAAGDDPSAAEDETLRRLDAELAFYQRIWASLRTEAVAAQARLLGLAARPLGYGAPTPTGRKKNLGPLVLTVAVGVVEWLQTAAWFSSKFSLYEASIGGGFRTFLVLAISAFITTIVMWLTFQAGRKVKEGALAQRSRKAEAVATGAGGERGIGFGLAALAAFFQMITLALRFSSQTGDQSAQAAAVVIGLISFCGALGVFLWEYASYMPPPESAQLAYTRTSDTERVNDFRQAEERRYAGIERDKRDLQIRALRREEKALERLQNGAMEAGTLQMSKLNAKLDGIRRDIRSLYEKTFNYDAFDLDSAAEELSARQARRV